MDKQFALTALKSAQADYTKAYNFPYGTVRHKFLDHLQIARISDGLCYYLQNFHSDDDAFDLMTELERDRDHSIKGTFWYWYPTTNDFITPSDIQAFAIWPRLDNINRTIARLQQELNDSK